MTIGKELKRIRELNKPMSVAKFAKYVGVNAARLRKWEDAGVNPKQEDISTIENYFGVPGDELYKIGKFKFYSKENKNNPTKDEQIIALTITVKILQKEVERLRAKVFNESTTLISLEYEKLIKEGIKQLLDEN